MNENPSPRPEDILKDLLNGLQSPETERRLEALRQLSALNYSSEAVRNELEKAASPDSDESGSRTFEQLSPTGGIRWTWLDGRPQVLRDLSLFATIGTAFQTPTTTELANPDGVGFNPDVQPQTSVTYELGGRAHWPGNLITEASTYYIEVDDELIQFESPSGRQAYRNAGHSRRYGLELDWQARLFAPLRGSGRPCHDRTALQRQGPDDGGPSRHESPAAYVLLVGRVCLKARALRHNATCCSQQPMDLMSSASAEHRNPAIDRWLASRSADLAPLARHWFGRVRDCRAGAADRSYGGTGARRSDPARRSAGGRARSLHRNAPAIDPPG
jgi:hypothetical protein